MTNLVLLERRRLSSDSAAAYFFQIYGLEICFTTVAPHVHAGLLPL